MGTRFYFLYNPFQKYIFIYLCAGGPMNNKKILSIILLLLSSNNILPEVNELKIGLSPEIANDVAKILEGSGDQINKNVDTFMRQMGNSIPHVGPGIVSLGESAGQAIKPVAHQILVGYAAILGAGFASSIVYEAIKKYIAKYLFEPKLIEKRSSSWITEKLLSPFYGTAKVKLEDHMIISDQLSENLHYIMNMTKNIKKNGGQFEHVLLHGEPGTGKTLFAQLLAEHCGMSYALVPAANVSQFLTKGTAVEELNELFTWAASNSNGTILFFDEAETFLGKRSTLSNEAQNALAAFLVKTGTPSDKIMVICATNRPEIMDDAVLSRLGFRVDFPLPDLKAREAQLAMHVKKIFTTQKGTKVSYRLLQDPEYLTYIAEQLEGCSGRTIQKVVNRLRQTALSEDVTEVSKGIVTRVINQVHADKVFAAQYA